MDVHDRLTQLTTMVRNAKTMPMSASCLVNRAEMLDLLERLREELPADLDHADALLSEREAVLADAREQAERILETARGERGRLIEQTDVLVAARELATRLTIDSRAQSTRLLADADDYVDRKLAEFDDFLSHVASQVNNGRLRLTTRREADLAHFQGTAPASAGESWRHPDGPAEHDLTADPGTEAPQGPADRGVPLGAL